MKTASEVIAFIGQDKLQSALGVQSDAIRKAKASGILPASWYNTMEHLAGRPLPREIFSFKGAAQ